MSKRGRKKLYGGILHVRLPAELLKKINERAKKGGLTMSDWARKWLLSAAIAKDEKFHASLEKTLEPLKPMFERMGTILTEEMERNPDFIKEVLEKALRAILEEQIAKMGFQT